MSYYLYKDKTTLHMSNKAAAISLKSREKITQKNLFWGRRDFIKT
jgi:hypothetical protein